MTVGGALIAGGLFLAMHRYRFSSHGSRAEGIVVGQSEWRSHQSLFRYPIVEFRTAKGETVRFQGSTEGMTTGTNVGVVYDPEHPYDALISTDASLWAAPFMIALLGFSIILPALYFSLYGPA